ncbi:hypothetical protein PtB15_2B58 [Puccinia triticina]|nr:hypothetical protein PtB15_2B58 [Puccinia triticina]
MYKHTPLDPPDIHDRYRPALSGLTSPLNDQSVPDRRSLREITEITPLDDRGLTPLDYRRGPVTPPDDRHRPVIKGTHTSIIGHTGH